MVSLLICSAGFGQTKKKKRPSKPPTSNDCETETGLYCEIHGSGDPILALHGLGASLYSWRNLKEKFPNHKLILIDLKGAGKSPKPRDKHYSTPEQADLILRFIREHDLKNLTLVGNSYGGAVSLIVAPKLIAEDRGRLSRLILIDSGGYDEKLPIHLKLLRTPVVGRAVVNLLPSKTAARLVLEYAYSDECRITQEQIDSYAEPISSRKGRYALLQSAKQAIPDDIDDITDKYKTINVPTLILWGEDDHVIPISIGNKLDNEIPNSTLLLIKYAGHAPQEEQPDATICQMKLFLGYNVTCPPQTPSDDLCPERKKSK